MGRLSGLLVGVALIVWPASTLASGLEKPVPLRLVLLITVDQFRTDYVDRFRGLFKGGLKRLFDEGVYFREARHQHANTTTGPGHATLATGLHPSRHGIIGNTWYQRSEGSSVNCVEDKSVKLVGSDSGGRSPRRLLAGGLGDWLKSANPAARVYGASMKDRGAILSAGLKPDGAFWYSLANGTFISSNYYMDRIPEWLKELNGRRFPHQFFGQPWTLRLQAPAPREADVSPVDRGAYADGFPRALGTSSLQPNRAFFADFARSSGMDAYLGKLAQALVRYETLGQEDAVDLLALSFSALDLVGHAFGPNSPEVLDVLLGLDQVLGELFAALEREVGMQHVAVALSSDHGVLPLPEHPSSLAPLERRRIDRDDVLCLQRSGALLEERLGEGNWLLSGYYLNYETIGRRNQQRDEVEAVLAEILERCSAVQKVWKRTDLSEENHRERFAVLYANGFHPRRSPDLQLQFKKGVLAILGTGTTHGSPYDYDRHVPLVFLVPGIPGRSISQPVSTVDVAPTLAALAGIKTPPNLDGDDLSSLLREVR